MIRIPISVTLDPALVKRLDAVAKKEGRTRSAMVEKLLKAVTAGPEAKHARDDSGD